MKRLIRIIGTVILITVAGGISKADGPVGYDDSPTAEVTEPPPAIIEEPVRIIHPYDTMLERVKKGETVLVKIGDGKAGDPLVGLVSMGRTIKVGDTVRCQLVNGVPIVTLEAPARPVIDAVKKFLSPITDPWCVGNT